MSVIYIALPIALLLGGAGMFACVLCIRGGQYDDMDTPSIRMLIEDREQKKK
jgi:cbb3-type cytochrome oxidase maturation protein